MGEMREFWRQQLRENDERQERLQTTIMQGSNNMVAFERNSGARGYQHPHPTAPELHQCDFSLPKTISTVVLAELKYT